MTTGFAIGLYPIGHDPRLVAAQVIPPFASQAQRPDVGIVIAVELKVALVAAPATVVTKYLSTHAFCSGSSDDLPNVPFEGRIVSCLVTRQIERGSWPYTGDPDGQRRREEDRFVWLTNGLATAGAVIELANNDGQLDDWPDIYYVDGRRAEIKLSVLGADERVGAYDDFATVYVGEAGPWERGVNTLRLNVSSLGARLKKPIGNTFYAGTGQHQGAAELADMSRPQAYGRVINHECQPVDDLRAILQVHDEAIQQVFAVRDKGLPLAATGVDYLTYAALRDATTGPSDDEETDSDIPPGSYATCLAAGYIKLGSDPAGMVTADLWGDIAANRGVTQEPWDDGTYWDDGYGWAQQSLTLPVDTVAGIIYRIESSRAGLLPVDINESAFARYDAEQPARCGYAVPTGDGRVVLDVEAEIAWSDHAFVYPDQYGRRAVRRLSPPEGSSPHSIDDLAIMEIEQVDIPYGVPPSRIRVWFARNWRQQSADDLAAGVSPTQQIVRRRYGRVVATTVADVAAAHLSNRSADFFCFFEDLSAASDLMYRLTGFYALGRRMWRVVAMGQLFRIELGDTVRLTSSRFESLIGGRFCVALAAIDDPVEQTTELLLFG